MKIGNFLDVQYADFGVSCSIYMGRAQVLDGMRRMMINKRILVLICDIKCWLLYFNREPGALSMSIGPFSLMYMNAGILHAAQETK